MALAPACALHGRQHLRLRRREHDDAAPAPRGEQLQRLLDVGLRLGVEAGERTVAGDLFLAPPLQRLRPSPGLARGSRLDRAVGRDAPEPARPHLLPRRPLLPHLVGRLQAAPRGEPAELVELGRRLGPPGQVAAEARLREQRRRQWAALERLHVEQPEEVGRRPRPGVVHDRREHVGVRRPAGGDGGVEGPQAGGLLHPRRLHRPRARGAVDEQLRRLLALREQVRLGRAVLVDARREDADAEHAPRVGEQVEGDDHADQHRGRDQHPGHEAAPADAGLRRAVVRTAVWGSRRHRRRVGAATPAARVSRPGRRARTRRPRRPRARGSRSSARRRRGARSPAAS